VTPNGDARAAADPSESSFIRLAEAYRREGLLADAIRICREGLTRCQTSLRGRILLGQSLLEQGATPAAMTEFDRVEREALGNPEILALLREARRSVSPQPTDAIESAEAADPWIGAPAADRDPANEPGVLFLNFSEHPDTGGQPSMNAPVNPLASSTLAALYADQGDPARAEAIRRQLEVGGASGSVADSAPQAAGVPGTQYLDKLIRLREVVQRLQSGHPRSA
jgi:hypothetical protein